MSKCEKRNNQEQLAGPWLTVSNVSTVNPKLPWLWAPLPLLPFLPSATFPVRKAERALIGIVALELALQSFPGTSQKSALSSGQHGVFSQPPPLKTIFLENYLASYFSSFVYGSFKFLLAPT